MSLNPCWYVYCPEDGFTAYSSEEEARAAAQAAMADYAETACSDGWHEDMELLQWGLLVPLESAQIVDRWTPTEEDEDCLPCSLDEVDEVVRYELRPARVGAPQGEAAP